MRPSTPGSPSNLRCNSSWPTSATLGAAGAILLRQEVPTVNRLDPE